MGCIHSKPCCSPAAASASAASPDSTSDPIPRTHSLTHVLTGCPVGSAAVPSAGVSLLFSSLTQRGHYPDSPLRENQDALAVEPHLQSDPDLHLFAVLDGHGQFGAHCAAFARRALLETLAADPLLRLDPSKSFHAAFRAANSLLHASDIDDSMSGTTAVAVLVAGDSLVAANCGDSRAVAGVWDADRGAVVAKDLSCDQTPFRKDEYERVRMCGARVLSVDQVEGIKDPEVQSWGDEESDDGDPPRLWVQDGMYPGTAFTRSLGDATAESIGVVAVPEVLTMKITPELLFFVVASDGVFEFLSSQAVVSMVANYKDPRDACAAIASESYRLWLEHENRTDDITIIIVHIKDISDSGAATTEEVNQISTKPCVAVSEKAQAERYVFHGSGTCHSRKDNFSELQSCPEFAVERSPACVVPSPEHNLSLQT